MSLLRPSVIRTKRKGENGSPYLIFQVDEKSFIGELFSRMEKKGMVTKAMTHSTHFELKPYALSILSKYFQLSLS